MSSVDFTPAQTPQRRSRSFPAMRCIIALMLREMSTKFGRTPGGYIWAIVEPIGALAVLTILFSLLMRTPPLGNSFVLFYASGFLVFTLYMTIQTSAQQAIAFSKPLLRYPAVSWVDAIIARIVLTFLTGVTVMLIVFVGLLQIVSVTSIFEFGPILLSISLAAVLGAGLGTLNCVAAGLYPAYGAAWGIASRPLFIIAGVIFLYDDMPPGVQDILWYTPWIHFTSLFRAGIYPSYEPDFVSIPLVLAWSLIPMFFGLLLLRRHYQTILNR